MLLTCIWSLVFVELACKLCIGSIRVFNANEYNIMNMKAVHWYLLYMVLSTTSTFLHGLQDHPSADWNIINKHRVEFNVPPNTL